MQNSGSILLSFFSFYCTMKCHNIYYIYFIVYSFIVYNISNINDNYF